ncbi:MAG: hypothetical protein P8X47_12275, partial [Ignavibacteriaceae bacterium]
DPVMAIKELHEYPDAINYYDLRFRIQQVGLTTQNRDGDQPNYAEIYSVDLEADEAANQNVRTFVDALLIGETVNKSKEIAQEKKSAKSKKRSQASSSNPALNKEHNTQATIREVEQTETKRRMQVLNSSEYTEEDAKKVRRKITNHNLDEDKDFDLRTISKVNVKVEKPDSKKVSSKKSNPPAPGIKKSENTKTKAQDKKRGAFGEFLEKKMKEEDLNLPLNSKDKPKQMVEIIKSPTSLNKFLENKEDKQVVLKIKNQK